MNIKEVFERITNLEVKWQFISYLNRWKLKKEVIKNWLISTINVKIFNNIFKIHHLILQD